MSICWIHYKISDKLPKPCSAAMELDAGLKRVRRMVISLLRSKHQFADHRLANIMYRSERLRSVPDTTPESRG